ncbi:MAG: hypothetical protein IPK22_11365 [Verrucomicrobiaceae bacterium]|nr:hypothetical protein [Verrucomicrobiaceae bacterium]
MKPKPATSLLCSITLYITAAVRWMRLSLRTPSAVVAQQARRTVKEMIISARACEEVWCLCNAPMEAMT